MLVFKRALSLLLSLSMVFAPSLAFARNGVKSHQFQAQDTASFERAVRKQSKKAGAKRGGKLATADEGSVVRSAETIFPKVHIAGHDFSLSQITGPSGRISSQTLAGRDFQELLVDEYGTGTASTWKVTRGNVEVTASRPYRGAFTQIDVRERRAKAFVNVRMQLNSDLRTYRVVASSIDPYKIDHQVERPGSAQLQIMCEDQVPNNLKAGAETLRQLTERFGRTNPETAISCLMNRYSAVIFDSSCSHGDFASSTKAMSDGIAKVLASTQQARGPKSAMFPSGRSQYLQCMSDLGFAKYSADAQTKFFESVGKARASVQARTNRPDSVGAEDAKSCEPIKTINIYNNQTKSMAGAGALTDLLNPSVMPRKFSCNANQTSDSEYYQGVDKFSFKLAKDQMAQKYNGDAAQGYASLMFHEMVHSAGIPEDKNEELVRDLQTCCANPNPDSDESMNACGKISSKIAKLKALSRAEERGLSTQIPGYGELRARISRVLDETKTQEVMADWYEAVQKDPKATAALAEMNACLAKPGAKAESCENKVDGALRNFTRQFLKARGTIDNSQLVSQADQIAESVNRKNRGAVLVPSQGGYRILESTPESRAAMESAAQQAQAVRGLVPEKEEEAPEIVVVAPTRPRTRTQTQPQTQSQPSQPQTIIVNVPPQNQTSPQQPVVVTRDTPQPQTQQPTNLNTDSNANGQTNQTGVADQKTPGTETGAGGQTDVSTMPTTGTTPFVPKGAQPLTAAQNLAASKSSIQMPTGQQPSLTGQAPAFDPSGAQPLIAGQTPGSSTDNRFQSATALANLGGAATGAAVTAVASVPTLAGYVQPAQAQQRMPTAVSGGGGRSAPAAFASSAPRGASGESGDRSPEGEESARKASQKEDGKPGAGDEAENSQTVAAASAAGARASAKSATELADNLGRLSTSDATDVQRTLISVGYSKLEGALKMGEKSPFGRALVQKGWTIRSRPGQAPMLMNPSGRCFKTDPKRILIRLDSCG